MKTYKVKNYKGNLVESLSKFQKSHKGMKIVEACEDGDDLKIKAEESEKLEEASKKYIVTVKRHCKDCGKDHRALYSTLTYNAEDPISAARKAYEYLKDGGPYKDLGCMAKDKTIFFVVKESGTPKGEGITVVERDEVV